MDRETPGAGRGVRNSRVFFAQSVQEASLALQSHSGQTYGSAVAVGRNGTAWRRRAQRAAMTSHVCMIASPCLLQSQKMAAAVSEDKSKSVRVARLQNDIAPPPKKKEH